MIKANDLRIGNWYDHNGEFKQASPNTIEEVWKAERSWVMPIPLTPEILEKAGFVKMINPDNKYEQEYFANPDLNFGYPVLYLNKVSYLSQNCSIPTGYLFLEKLRIVCKYVHQLQNLYFTLTGEELTIKI